MKYMAAAITDAGIVKKINQDSLTVKIAKTSAGQVCMAVVCDGLGGLSQGEVASGNVVLAFDYWFKRQFLQSNVKVWTHEKIVNSWQEIITDMNHKIMKYGLRQGVEMGTTLTAVLFLQNKFCIAHIGDTRLYELADCCRQLTKDQTVTELKLEQKIITKEQAFNDCKNNVLLQCIGVTKNLEPYFNIADINNTAAYLLCSDGFRHAVSAEEIYQLCNPSNNNSQELMKNNLITLVKRIKHRGETDNISAVLIQAGSGIC